MTDKIILPVFNKDAIAAQTEPKLAAGDYRLVITREPKFFMGKKEGKTHLLSAAINWTPLVDPRDINSVAKYISVSQFLVCPMPVLSEEQAALPAANRPTVPSRDVSDTIRFFRALTGESVYNIGSRPDKGQTKGDHAAAYEAAVEAAYGLFCELYNNPTAVVSPGPAAWVVDARVKINGQYTNISFYSESYVKSGAATPPWSYSKPRMV